MFEVMPYKFILTIAIFGITTSIITVRQILKTGIIGFKSEHPQAIFFYLFTFVSFFIGWIGLMICENTIYFGIALIFIHLITKIIKHGKERYIKSFIQLINELICILLLIIMALFYIPSK